MLSLFILLCVLLGITVGFVSGLLGMGGGLVIVPALMLLLPMLDVPADIIIPLALGTSLCSIVITSSVASFVHFRNGNIPVKLTKKFIIPIALGSLTGALVADLLSVHLLKSMFAFVVSALAFYMLVSIRLTKTLPLPNTKVLFILAYVCGVIASLMGISGAVILIPILLFFDVSLRHSIGLATTCGAIVAACGTTGYIISGLGASQLPEWSIGYIYLPALFSIAVTSTIFAPYGVKFASKLSVKTLNRCFALFLLAVALKMIFL